MPLARCLIYNAIEGIAVEAGTIARTHYTNMGNDKHHSSCRILTSNQIELEYNYAGMPIHLMDKRMDCQLMTV